MVSKQSSWRVVCTSLGASPRRKFLEPHARGVAALDSPSTGIVDFAAVARSMAAGLRDRDAEVVTGCAVETVSVDMERLKRITGNFNIYFTIAFNLGKVTNPS